MTQLYGWNLQQLQHLQIITISTQHVTATRQRWSHTKQDERFALERRQTDHFLVGDKVELVKDGVVLCQVLVLVQFLLATEPRTVHCKQHITHTHAQVSSPCPVTGPPGDTSWYLGMWLDLTTTRLQTWLFSSTSTYHSTDLLTARGVAHLVVHGTSGSTSYETIPPVRLDTSGGVLSTVDMVVQQRDSPRWLPDHDDDDDDDDNESLQQTLSKPTYHQAG